MSSLSDVVAKIGTLTTTLGSLVTAVNNKFPRVTGTFTLAAAATTLVNETQVQATSNIILIPTNAAAGTLMGSAKSLYISAVSSGTSFTVATASGVAAAGTETFNYVVY